MPRPDTVDEASLDAFTTSLIRAGFEADPDGRTWIGPLHPALARFTTADEMRVVVRDGWPYLHPRTYVAGIPTGLHRTTNGDVCLWEDGDPSMAWLTWDGISQRIEKWAEETQGTGSAEDPGFDPHVYFNATRGGLATVDLTGVPIRDWDARDLRATLDGDGVLEIGEGPLHGRLYTRDRPRIPPTGLAEARAGLRRRQQRDLEARLQTVGERDGLAFVVFAWTTPAGPNLLVLRLGRSDAGDLDITVHEAARTDIEVLRMRAGPDAALLAEKTVVLFGAGAIGSHIADLLTRSGVGTLRIYDTQWLRPGDVVRHGSFGLFVGKKKVGAVSLKALITAPWSTVDKHDAAPWQPSVLSAAVEGADLAIDATGLKTFAAQLSLVCAAAGVTMASAALYRHGDIGRLRMQRGTPGALINDRAEPDYPQIPEGAGETEVACETGCASPVAQAPPIAVAAIAATAARQAVEILADRSDVDQDIVEIFRPLDAAPFDHAGTIVFP